MRIRILSEFEQQANLPVIRSWFNVDRENTVTSLKLSLCASLPALRDAHVRAEELVLALDDFELLNDSPIHILRDGDLICLRRRTHLPKRRAEYTEDTSRKRRRPLPVANSAAGGRAPVGGIGLNGFMFQAPGPPVRGRSIESSSSSSSSSSSDTSSDADTTSDDTSSNSESTSESTSGSSSDSDSDSDSDSINWSSSDILRRRVPRPPPPSFEHQRKPSQPRPAPIPPGFGKPQTHKRNERRRKKRVASRGSSDVPAVPAGGSNAIALGVAKSVPTPKPTTTTTPMMMSSKNKNKRRDFKNTIGTPSHITFQDNGAAAPSPPPKTLIPPSERGQLPPRMFVTSVDVEEDKWPRGNDQNWDRKQKKMQRESYGQAADDKADITLDYGKTPEEDRTASISTLDYTALENAWVDAPPIEEKATLQFGCVVGWQELGINPTTRTPEMMVFLARVVSGSDGSAVVVRLHCPGSGTASFAGGDSKDEEEEEEFTWDKILEMHWRLISS